MPSSTPRHFPCSASQIGRTRCSQVALATVWLLACCLAPVTPLQAQADWKTVKIPETWKNPPAGEENLSWYRTFVTVPAEWRESDLELFVEPFDAAHEVYVNGRKVGNAGEFPPFFRSGLGGRERFLVPAGSVRFDRPNVVALRVYNQEGRTGFNVAAPVLFGKELGVRLAGDWQFRPGDNPEFARYDAADAPQGLQAFRQTASAEELNRSLKRIDDAGPQTPAAALALFKLPDDLELEVAVAEPDIRQPLSIKWDARGRLWVCEFIQYPDPAGLKMVARDKFLRSVYDRVPPPPPRHFPGLDRISIHEDTDGDGRYDQHRVFVEGLSLCSSFAFDRDGLWVLQPPYLLFYPDRDHDDRPDGDPTVHLEGFGLEDSHSIANSLRWGPDGWLYGAQGSTVTGVIRRPQDSPDSAIRSQGQCIWRYHPGTGVYEVFGEGGGNSFGLEIDSRGRIFSGHNGGNTRGFHYVQGGYYRKGFEKHGSLSNPYAFGFFEQMLHDNVPRFTHQFVIYEGTSPDAPQANGLPAQYHGQLFGIGPLQGHVVRSELSPHESSLKTRDIDHPVTTSDTWFRPVDLQQGPDGALYIVDLYEQRIDHASHYQGRIDRDRGRVYRLKRRGGAALPPFDLTRQSAAQLVALLQHPNRWFRETALNLLAWRQPLEVLPTLKQQVATNTQDSAVAPLWALNRLQALNEPAILEFLGHASPWVRNWTIRLSCDSGHVSPAVLARLVSLAQVESSAIVRSQLASSARRLPGPQALALIEPLLSREADLSDVHIPLLVWWALEAHAETSRDEVVSLFRKSPTWERKMVREQIAERLMRRYALAGTRRDLLTCAQLLDAAPTAELKGKLLAGFEKAYEGRALVGLPEELLQSVARAGGGSTALRLRQQDPAALREALALLAKPDAPRADRLRFLQILSETHPPEARPVLLELARQPQDAELAGQAIAAVQAYDDPALGGTLVGLLSSLPTDARQTALNVLASRRPWARELVASVVAGRVAKESIPTSVLQRLLLLRDAELSQQVEQHFGPIQGASTAQMLAEVDRVKQLLTVGTGSPYNGRKLFLANCGKCHVLFDEGGRLGPELTSYQRTDLGNLLVNVINPSSQIREGFENYVALTKDGRAINGFIADQDARVVVLRGTDGQTTSLTREEIDELAASPQSLMPENLLKDYSDQQIRDLFSYLRATQPLAVR